MKLWRIRLGNAFSGSVVSELEKIIVRKVLIDIDAFDPSYYCSGKVARPRALQPQQNVRVRCLQNQRETHYFFQHLIFLIKPMLFHHFRDQILTSRSWLADPGFQILASRSWLPHPGYRILATRSWLPHPAFQIQAGNQF